MSSFEPQVLQGLEVEQSCCSQPVGTLMWTWGHRRRSALSCTPLPWAAGTHGPSGCVHLKG